jgi:hypothetical protein
VVNALSSVVSKFCLSLKLGDEYGQGYFFRTKPFWAPCMRSELIRLRPANDGRDHIRFSISAGSNAVTVSNYLCIQVAICASRGISNA